MKWESLDHVWFFATPLTVAHQVPLSMEFSRQKYWSELPLPSPGNLPTQRSNLGLLHCAQIFYYLSLKGSPIDHQHKPAEQCQKQNTFKNVSNKRALCRWMQINAERWPILNTILCPAQQMGFRSNHFIPKQPHNWEPWSLRKISDCHCFIQAIPSPVRSDLLFWVVWSLL